MNPDHRNYAKNPGYKAGAEGGWPSHENLRNVASRIENLIEAVEDWLDEIDVVLQDHPMAEPQEHLKVLESATTKAMKTLKDMDDVFVEVLKDLQGVQRTSRQKRPPFLSRLFHCVYMLGPVLGWKYFSIERRAIADPSIMIRWTQAVERRAERCLQEGRLVESSILNAWARECRIRNNMDLVPLVDSYKKAKLDRRTFN